MRKVTLRDIAKEVGTSPATVSKVLTGRGDDLIGKETREHVLAVARKLGYSPNLAARALVTGRTHCIALWAETLADFHSIVANAFMDQLRPSQYEIVITDVVKHPDWHAYFQRTPLWPVDGIIALDSPHSVRAYLAASAGRNVPVVSVGAYYVTEMDYVGVDLASGLEAAVRHLYEEGCRRIAHLTCPHGMRPGDGRREAYEATVREMGMTPELLVAEQSSREDGRRTVLAAGERGDLPDGLVCFNDEMAIGACKALHEMGVAVPDRVAVTGCDGIPDTEYFPTSITTIVQPVETLCRTAWEFLRHRIEHPDAPRQAAILQPELRVRGSSRRRGAA